MTTVTPAHPPPSDHDVSSPAVTGDNHQLAQSRGQPTRQGTTLTVDFPLAVLYTCTEEFCSASYGSTTWTSQRQSLVRHLEQAHNIRITRTTNECDKCHQDLGLRPTTDPCLGGRTFLKEVRDARECPLPARSASRPSPRGRGSTITPKDMKRIGSKVRPHHPRHPRRRRRCFCASHAAQHPEPP